MKFPDHFNKTFVDRFMTMFDFAYAKRQHGAPEVAYVHKDLSDPGDVYNMISECLLKTPGQYDYADCEAIVAISFWVKDELALRSGQVV